MGEHKLGCCADGSCTSDTCMMLPAGKRCSDCAHVRRCTMIFGQDANDDGCQFFPRRFLERTFTEEDKAQACAELEDESAWANAELARKALVRERATTIALRRKIVEKDEALQECDGARLVNKFALHNEHLRAEAAEADVEKTIVERDTVMEVVDAVRDALGITSEWTNLYGYREFIDEAQCVIANLEALRDKRNALRQAIMSAVMRHGNTPMPRPTAVAVGNLVREIEAIIEADAKDAAKS